MKPGQEGTMMGLDDEHCRWNQGKKGVLSELWSLYEGAMGGEEGANSINQHGGGEGITTSVRLTGRYKWNYQQREL